MKTFSKTPSELNHQEKECVNCGGIQFKPLWKDSDLPFVKCRNCGLVFQNPQPFADELIERYDGEYFEYEIDNEDNFYNLMLLGLRDAGFFDIEKQLFEDAALQETKPVFVDIGCATGRLLSYMNGRGWAVSGVEVCEPAARYGMDRHGIDIHIGPLESACLPASSVDIVHCSHLIEHLTDPDAFVAAVSRILKPGGYFIVVTPDISGFQARLFGSKWRSAIADHMYLFSKRTLSDLLRKNGFSVIKKASWGGLAAGTAPGWLKSFADRTVKAAGIGDVVCIMGMISR